ncbi:hypothetical protein CKAH01_13698 [Colletotrichum kahawae]|uniref:Uncharacterized protein n=1 Tax=Colletotrichum kahawae TaxID=34407 RepID=A0AAD9YRV1_COLKA|nr:hypothetical protein CKAH01_13698 [Colletotrichum kahawae]
MLVETWSGAALGVVFSANGGKVSTLLRVMSGRGAELGFTSGPGVASRGLGHVLEVWTLSGQDFTLRGSFMFPAAYRNTRLQNVKASSAPKPITRAKLTALHKPSSSNDDAAREEDQHVNQTNIIPHHSKTPFPCPSQAPISFPHPIQTCHLPSSSSNKPSRNCPIRALREFEQDTCIRASAAARRRPAPLHLIRRANHEEHTHTPATNLSLPTSGLSM